MCGISERASWKSAERWVAVDLFYLVVAILSLALTSSRTFANEPRLGDLNLASSYSSEEEEDDRDC